MRVKIVFGGQEVSLLIRWKHIQMPKGQETEINETGRKAKGITYCYLIMQDITLMTGNNVLNSVTSSTAYCSQQDTFNKFTGRKVSLTKALQASPLSKEQRKQIWNQFLIENKNHIQ